MRWVAATCSKHTNHHNERLSGPLGTRRERLSTADTFLYNPTFRSRNKATLETGQQSAFNSFPSKQINRSPSENPISILIKPEGLDYFGSQFDGRRFMLRSTENMQIVDGFEAKMAAGAGVSSPLSKLDGGYVQDNSVSGDEENANCVNAAGKPPRFRHCASTAWLVNSNHLDVDLGSVHRAKGKDGFLPTFRSGSYTDIGPKPSMEDEHICIDNLVEHLGTSAHFPFSGAFYGVFDGHGGSDAALFIRKNILRFVLEDSQFPNCMNKVIRNAYIKADQELAKACSLDSSSGTTALTALILGRTLVIANVGDCRAVLGKRGRAVEMSRDHKPNCSSEKSRIEKLGGTVYDGYLNGQLSVSRALGDWHIKGLNGSFGPLSAEAELQEAILTEEDEFLIMGCDGLWDVMSSQFAVTMSRKELMLHNDPERCSRELVTEALKRHTCDNLTVIVVCFSAGPPPRIEVPKSRVRRSISDDGLNFLKGMLEGNA